MNPHPLSICYLVYFGSRIFNSEILDNGDELCNQLYCDRQRNGFNGEVRRWKL